MLVAFDTETHVIRPGCVAPPLVCASYMIDGSSPDVVGRDVAFPIARAIFEDASVVVGHNIAFDSAVLVYNDASLIAPVFAAYERGRVRDTMIRELLRGIRDGDFERTRGRCSLGDLAHKYLGHGLEKGPDSWRTRYAELEHVSLAQWPASAIAYPKADAASTLGVYQRQDNFTDEVLQTRAAFALQLMSAHGLRTDRDAIDALECDFLERYLALGKALQASGLVRSGKEEGTRDMTAIRARVERAYGPGAPRSDPSTRFPNGQISTSADTLSESGDPELERLVEYGQVKDWLGEYIPTLRLGTDAPITPRYNVLVETGRPSCSAPNLYNLPRKGGIRECFIPSRENHVFVAADLDTAELRALAQICYSWFGHSNLREAFIAGRDPHLELGAKLLGISYEDAIARRNAGDETVIDARQFAKIPNFGFPGGLGVQSFVFYARRYGVRISVDEATGTLPSAIEARSAWFEQWSEMRPYFRLIAEITGDHGPKRIEQYGSGRVRGQIGFTQAANGMFQSLIADAAKDALWAVTRACYCEPSSALYGSRPIVFLYDEIILESPADKASAAGDELARVMVDVVQKWLPDVPVLASPKLMKRWYKKAETVRDEHGSLIPWGKK